MGTVVTCSCPYGFQCSIGLRVKQLGRRAVASPNDVHNGWADLTQTAGSVTLIEAAQNTAITAGGVRSVVLPASVRVES